MAASSRRKEAPRGRHVAPNVQQTPRAKSKSVSNAKSVTPKATLARSSTRKVTPKDKSTTKKASVLRKSVTGKEAGPSPNSDSQGTESRHAGKRAEMMDDDTLVVCGKEVCGRKLALWDDAMGDWRDGEVVRFKPSIREHLIRFLDRPSGSVKHEESWFELSKHRFRWLSPVPDDAAANPSYRKAPKRKAAVGTQVKVFWTGMGKWYQGKVLEYDTETKMHTVKYKDGDVQTLALRHEAVIYLDASGGGSKNGKKAIVKDAGMSKAGVKKASAQNAGSGANGAGAKDEKKRGRVNQAGDGDGGEPGKKRANVETQAKREQTMHLAVIGSRLGVYDASTKGLKRCTIENYKPEDDTYEVLFDDGKSDWIHLAEKEFRFLTPKTRSGGCGPPFLNAMDKLGAEQMKPPGKIIHASGMGGTAKPAETISRRAPIREACVNWRLSIRGTDKKWYLGEVIAYHQGSDRHVVLYDDGEHEVVHLPSELIAWHVYTKDTKKVFYPGKPKTTDPPAGKEAIGWRVAVFWPAEKDFFRGKITGYDEFTKAFDVSYDDGDRSIVRLADDRMKWVLPPGTEYDTAPFKHRVEVIIPITEEESIVVSEEKKTGSNKKARQLKPARKLKGTRAGHLSGSLYSYGSPYEGPRNLMKDRQEFATEPVVVRNISAAPMLPSNGEADGALVHSAIAVRIYLSDSSKDTDSAAREAADEVDGTSNDNLKNNNVLHGVDEMMRRVSRAEESILKGYPTYPPTNLGEDARKLPHRLDRLSLNPKMVMHRKVSRMIENDSESDNLNNMSSKVNFSPSVSPKFSRFRKEMSPLGSSPKIPPESSSGSSDDEEVEDILISPQEATGRTVNQAPAFAADEGHQDNDIFSPNDTSGPMESPFSEPAIQGMACDGLLSSDMEL